MINPICNIVERTLAKLPYEPLPGQYILLNTLEQFVISGAPNSVFILNGYAGTGKTSIAGAFIKTLGELHIPVVLLAPTGRAAKVASAFAGHPASTIHKCLYRGDSVNPGNTDFFLVRNTLTNAIFIVDEASLISDFPGSARSLLSHLIHYIYSSPGCKLILIGDEAQLPPVGQDKSWAMDPERLKRLGLEPFRYTLDLPVRQASESGIIYNATYIRFLISKKQEDRIPELYVRDYRDVVPVSSRDLEDLLAKSWSEVGKEETLVVTRSNLRANNFNQAIRNMVMYADEPLQRGDRIIITKNDYYWSKINALKSFIANGDMAEITWVGKTEKAYGRYFTEVEMKLIGDGSILNAKVMLRSLVAKGPSVPREEMEHLYNRVMDSYEGSLSEKIKGTISDPFYNALQVKYAYCVTCHKAQGGQWKHVYIDMGGIAAEAMDTDFYRWLYTAFTRATQKVFLINPTLPLR